MNLKKEERKKERKKERIIDLLSASNASRNSWASTKNLSYLENSSMKKRPKYNHEPNNLIPINNVREWSDVVGNFTHGFSSRSFSLGDRNRKGQLI